jgi:hypothetical protein
MKRSHIPFSLVLTWLAAFGLSACQDAMEDFGSLTLNQISDASPFTRAAADTMTISDFRRTFGVGFSYDGIWGERCNLKDVHCRVLDLDAIRRWEQEEEWHTKLFTIQSESSTTYSASSSYSGSSFRQSTTTEYDAEAEMIIFNGKVAGGLTYWESGYVNDFHAKVEYVSPSTSIRFAPGSVASLVRNGRTDLLTPNFREVIDWIARYPDDEAVVDSFLTLYGSHVVCRSRLGGSLTIQMTMKRDSLYDVISNTVMAEAVVQSLIRSKIESEDVQQALHQLNSADCSITVKGGDLSAIPNHLLHFRFGECPNLSSYVGEWIASINYASDDLSSNNLEMVDMEIKPIWDFIPDKDVAHRVKRRVQGTAKELIREGGYQNFTNTSFQLPESVTCKMGGQSTTFYQPAVCNVLAAGRYVATICREQIDLPEVGVKEVQVVYPIYDQQVNLSCGYTTYGDAAYNVCWLKGQCTVEKDTVNTPTPDGTIYMTDGVPKSIHSTNIQYQPSQLVIGYEWPLSITKEGMLDMSKPYYLTYKSGADFLLRTADGQEQSGNLEGMPNWTFRDGRMVRNKESEYYYYWNPNEVNY